MDGGSGLASVPDELQRRLTEKLRRELGPVVCAFLTERDVIEIMLNPDGLESSESRSALQVQNSRFVSKTQTCSELYNINVTISSIYDL
jgi:hypothetical protein